MAAAAELTVQLPADAQTWNEFNPVLQHLTVQLTGPGIADQRDISFGLRQIKVDGKADAPQRNAAGNPRDT